MNPDKYVKRFPEGKFVKCVGHPLDSNRNPTPEQLADYEKSKRMTKGLYNFITETSLPSREKILALAKLEEFAMWANKAIFHYKEVE